MNKFCPEADKQGGNTINILVRFHGTISYVRKNEVVLAIYWPQDLDWEPNSDDCESHFGECWMGETRTAMRTRRTGRDTESSQSARENIALGLKAKLSTLGLAAYTLTNK